MKTLTVISSLVCILLAGCSSNNLTRDKALQIIKEGKLYPKVFDYDIFCGDPVHAWKVLESGLEEQGFLTVDRTQEAKDIGKPFVHFTAKASPYLLPTPEEDRASHIQKVKLADEILGQVTGIKTTGNEKNAAVQYTTTYIHITPFSVLLKQDLNQTRNNKIYLSLYDDGWRIEKKPGIEFLELEQ